MNSYRHLVIFLVLIVLGALAPAYAIHVEAAQEHAAATPAAAAPTAKELELLVKVQQLEETLKATRIGAAQCDAAAADTRAQLNSVLLSSEADRLQASSKALDDSAKAAGMAIERDPQTQAIKGLKKLDPATPAAATK
jgi:hypothetical protein